MLRSLALALTCLLLPTAVLNAQTAPPYNRAVTALRIVHPPGTPPGTWKVEADLEFYTDDTVPLPANLDCDGTLTLNGVPIQLQAIEAQSAAGPLCNFATCNGGQCGPWTHISGLPFPGYCKLITLGSGAQACGCWSRIVYDWGPFGNGLVAGDQIGITLAGSALALSEPYTADDVLVLDVADNPIGTAHCFGDGTTPIACPCGNSGALGRGCENSAGTGGALLEAHGLADPDLTVLTSSGELASALSIFLQGNASAPSGLAFGDGVRCVTGTLKRLYVRNASGGTVSAPQSGDASITARSAQLGDPIAPGSTREYQVYYRDPDLAFCGAPLGGSFNVTNAVRLDW